jgi:hypothetical protein
VRSGGLAVAAVLCALLATPAAHGVRDRGQEMRIANGATFGFELMRSEFRSQQSRKEELEEIDPFARRRVLLDPGQIMRLDSLQGGIRIVNDDGELACDADPGLHCSIRQGRVAIASRCCEMRIDDDVPFNPVRETPSNHFLYAGGPGPRSATIARGQLPGPGWVVPYHAAQLGRVARVFAQAARPCPASKAREPVAVAAAATAYSRLGRGLSFAFSVAASYGSTRGAEQIYGIALSPAIARCINRSLNGGGLSATTSRLDLGSFGDETLGYRFHVRSSNWTGNLDLVQARSGRLWALYIFFSTAPASPDPFERAIIASRIE